MYKADSGMLKLLFRCSTHVFFLLLILDISPLWGSVKLKNREVNILRTMLLCFIRLTKEVIKNKILYTSHHGLKLLLWHSDCLIHISQTGKLGSRLILVKKKKGVRSARLFRSPLKSRNSCTFQLQKYLGKAKALWLQAYSLQLRFNIKSNLLASQVLRLTFSWKSKWVREPDYPLAYNQVCWWKRRRTKVGWWKKKRKAVMDQMKLCSIWSTGALIKLDLSRTRWEN